MIWIDFLISDLKKSFHLWSELLIGVSFIDAFKIMNHVHKNGLNSFEEEKFYDISRMIDFDDVLSEVSSNPLLNIY